MGIKDEIRKEMETGLRRLEESHTVNIKEIKETVVRIQTNHEQTINKLFDLQRATNDMVQNHVAQSREANAIQQGSIAAAHVKAETAQDLADEAKARAEAAQKKADEAKQVAAMAEAALKRHSAPAGISKKGWAAIVAAISAAGAGLGEALKAIAHWFSSGGGPTPTAPPGH